MVQLPLTTSTLPVCHDLDKLKLGLLKYDYIGLGPYIYTQTHIHTHGNTSDIPTTADEVRLTLGITKFSRPKQANNLFETKIWY